MIAAAAETCARRWPRARRGRRARRPGTQRGLLAHHVHERHLATKLRRQEMNTFLTSMLVDLLAPVARKRGLDDARGAGPAASRGADREQRAGALPRAAGRARPSARWDASSRRTPTTRLWRGGSPGRAPATRARNACCGRLPAIATRGACTAPGSPRSRSTSVWTPGATRTRPTSPSRCTST